MGDRIIDHYERHARGCLRTSRDRGRLVPNNSLSRERATFTTSASTATSLPPKKFFGYAKKVTGVTPDWATTAYNRKRD